MISEYYQNLIFLMTLAITNDNKMLSKALQTLSAGAIASFLTQPFQVVKTNMIYSSIQRFNELHKQIIKNGWTQYMRGSSLAVLRQSYGFAIYTSIINKVNCYMDQHFLSLNKFYKYSIASLAGKFTAMLFEAPLTLLKTRREVMTSNSIKMEISIILKNPSEHISKGLGITLLREGVYSLLQYNMYRFFKDDLLMQKLNINSPFTAAFISGILSILISQPFEVIRSKISFSHGKQSIINCFNNQIKNHGWKGLWIGFLPRLVRKPINSGISWAIIQSIRSMQQI